MPINDTDHTMNPPIIVKDTRLAPRHPEGPQQVDAGRCDPPTDANMNHSVAIG